MGGWTAIELARRGRARSVCALSPAGIWEPGGEEMQRVFALLEAAARDARRSRRAMPLLARSARIRRHANRYVSIDGSRISRADLLTRIDEMLACELAPGRSEAAEALDRLDPVPCPLTIAWAEADRLFPPPRYLPRARSLFPAADLLILGGVGHVAMGDDPALVARLIRAAAEGTATPPPPGAGWWPAESGQRMASDS
jgi:pimeloyl-ACP methyl ester carboxylesterase